MIDIQWVDSDRVYSFTNGEQEQEDPLAIESLTVATLLQPGEGEAVPGPAAGPLWVVLPDGRWLNSNHIRIMSNS
jgi:hypothetical protein